MDSRIIVVEFSDGDTYIGKVNDVFDWMSERGYEESEIVRSFFAGQEIKLKPKLEIYMV